MIMICLCIVLLLKDQINVKIIIYNKNEKIQTSPSEKMVKRQVPKLKSIIISTPIDKNMKILMKIFIKLHSCTRTNQQQHPFYSNFIFQKFLNACCFFLEKKSKFFYKRPISSLIRSERRQKQVVGLIVRKNTATSFINNP